MNPPQKLEAIIAELRDGEARMKEGDHIAFGVLCLLIFFFALLCFIDGSFLVFTVLGSCLTLAIPLYYRITIFLARRSWYWEPIRRTIKGQDLDRMWSTSDRGDWLLWFSTHLVGKPGWPTHQQVVLASCQCARVALRHVPAGETRPLKAIETAEAWARGEATLEQVRNAGHAANCTTEHSDVAYCAAQAAHSAAWAVYATEDGVCFRLAQAASAAARWAADAAGYENFKTRLEAGDSSSGRVESDRTENATLRECADLVRHMLSVPNAVTNELPLYDWVNRWHRNSSGRRTGRTDHIPISVSRLSLDSCVTNGQLIENGPNPAWRIGTALMVLAATLFLVRALDGNSSHYYTILRWLTCSTAIVLIWRGDIQGSHKWAYLLVPIAILFNPIIPVHLHGKRMDVLGTWHTVDVATAAMLFLVLALMETQLWLTKRRCNRSRTT